MLYYIKQKVFSFKDKFNISTVDGTPKFYCESEFWAIRKKFHLQDMNGEELAFIIQKFFCFFPTYYIQKNGETVATVRKQFSFVHPRYSVPELGWEIKGDFWQHNYEIRRGFDIIATVSKKWISWGDTYQIEVHHDSDTENVLSTVIIIDAVMAQEQKSHSSGSSNGSASGN